MIKKSLPSVAICGQVLLIGICIFGCASSETTSPHQSPVEIPVDAAVADEAGCARVTLAAGASGCRGQWICGATTERMLLCSPNDAGTQCSCIEGDAATPLLSDSPCAALVDVPDRAKALCGWDVP